MLKPAVLVLFGVVFCLIGSAMANDCEKNTAVFVPASEEITLPSPRDIGTA